MFLQDRFRNEDGTWRKAIIIQTKDLSEMRNHANKVHAGIQYDLCIDASQVIVACDEPWRIGKLLQEIDIHPKSEVEARKANYFLKVLGEELKKAREQAGDLEEEEKHTPRTEQRPPARGATSIMVTATLTEEDEGGDSFQRRYNNEVSRQWKMKKAAVLLDMEEWDRRRVAVNMLAKQIAARVECVMTMRSRSRILSPYETKKAMLQVVEEIELTEENKALIDEVISETQRRGRNKRRREARDRANRRKAAMKKRQERSPSPKQANARDEMEKQ